MGTPGSTRTLGFVTNSALYDINTLAKRLISVAILSFSIASTAFDGFFIAFFLLIECSYDTHEVCLFETEPCL